MAGITRISHLYNTKDRPGRLGISRSTFHDNFVLKSEDDPFIPGTDVPRLRLLHLATNAAAAFDDEIDAVVEGLKRWRDKSFVDRPRMKRSRNVKSKNQPEATV
jgi:hypothetical protein